MALGAAREARLGELRSPWRPEGRRYDLSSLRDTGADDAAFSCGDTGDARGLSIGAATRSAAGRCGDLVTDSSAQHTPR